MVYYSEAHDGALVPDLREAVAQCVTSKGYKVSGKESLPQDFGSRFNSERTAAARQCVEEELERLYPEAAHLPFSMLD
jgi:hypothetical protein